MRFPCAQKLRVASFTTEQHLSSASAWVRVRLKRPSSTTAARLRSSTPCRCSIKNNNIETSPSIDTPHAVMMKQSVTSAQACAAERKESFRFSLASSPPASAKNNRKSFHHSSLLISSCFRRNNTNRILIGSFVGGISLIITAVRCVLTLSTPSVVASFSTLDARLFRGLRLCRCRRNVMKD